MKFEITVGGKRLRSGRVNKLVEALRKELGEGVCVTVRPVPEPKTRAERLAAAQELASEAKSEIESLMGELDDWLANLPEAFRDSKGDALQTAIDELGVMCNCLEEVEGNSVDFPSMYS